MTLVTSTPSSPAPRRPITEADVAVRLGISRATVSRALHGSGRVSAPTRRRVLEMAEQMGYVPNVMASELAAGRTRTVGLLLRDSYNPAYGLLHAQLQSAAHRVGVEVLTVTATGDVGASRQIAGLRRLLGMRVSGLIVATGDVASEQLLPFRDAVPMIRAGRPESDPGIHAVTYDEEHHASLLVQHVLGRGHRRVAVLTPAAVVSLPESVRASKTIRLLEAAGATVVPVPVQHNADGVTPSLDLVAKQDVTAVMCPTDLRALEVLREARARGLDVPGDLSVTGCDGVLPGLDLIGLTSVRLPVEDLAQRVVGHLLELMQTAQPDPVHESLRGELVDHGSVASLAGPGPGRR
jgi:DNA-binding LacI/PurR family transcriptional regulator